MSILSKITDALTAKRPGEPSIALLDQGFSIGDLSVDWDLVRQIRVYKLDLLTVDEIRLIFSMASGDSIEVSEEQPGFSELVAAMAARFPCTAQGSVADLGPRARRP